MGQKRKNRYFFIIFFIFANSSPPESKIQMESSLLIMIKTQLEVYGQRYENAEQNLKDEKDRTGKIDDEAEYIKTDEYVERVARDQLGLVHETETVFVKK